MFDGSSNVQLAGELLKIKHPKVSVMCGVEHTVSLFSNDVSKTPVVNKMITAHKAIYNLFGSEIYHKPHYIFKSKSYEFHNRNIGLFIGNDIPKWLVISLECTDICALEKNFLPHFLQLNSTLFH